MARPLLDDLDVNVFNVGKRIDGQVDERTNPHQDEEPGGSQHEQPLAEGEADELANHESALLVRAIQFARKQQAARRDDALPGRQPRRQR